MNDIRKLMESIEALEAEAFEEATTTVEEIELDEAEVEEAEQVDEQELTEAQLFQKRHYYFIADVIKNDFGGDPQVAQTWAQALASTNPQFKPKFFVDYATGVHNKKTAAHS